MTKATWPAVVSSLQRFQVVHENFGIVEGLMTTVHAGLRALSKSLRV